MNAMKRKTRRRADAQRGMALVIAIFSLLLISVVATALIITSGTQSAIKSNYRSATQAFYDAKAGLEEARGRMWPLNPDSAADSSAIINCILPGGAPMAVGQACYIINPAGSETVDPRDPANTYADLEYQQEWGSSVSASAPLIPSTSAASGLNGPLFKWVRITPRTEQSAKIDVNGNGTLDNTPLFFDGQNMNTTGSGAQVLTVTSLAVTPSNSRRMVQYAVAASPFTAALPIFPSALTLDGNGVTFNGQTGPGGGANGTFQIVGTDMDAPAGTSSGVPAIGYTNSGDGAGVTSAAVPSTNYISPVGVPNISFLPPWSTTAQNGIRPLLQTPSGLDSLVQSITQNADLVLKPAPGTAASQVDLPSNMSALNPMVVVVDGDFNLHGSGTGYGLLLVTGTLDYNPDAYWDGVILVIGKGVFTSNRRGVGIIEGAVFVAQTRDSSGNLLPDPNLGHSSFSQTGGGNGIRYSSSWVRTAQSLIPYQVLSFKEIAQATP